MSAKGNSSNAVSIGMTLTRQTSVVQPKNLRDLKNMIAARVVVFNGQSERVIRIALEKPELIAFGTLQSPPNVRLPRRHSQGGPPRRVCKHRGFQDNVSDTPEEHWVWGGEPAPEPYL
ncbi:hypothetical protein V8P78_30455, partial [Rhizobium sp. 6AS6]